jgi:hypothetical protein
MKRSAFSIQLSAFAGKTWNRGASIRMGLVIFSR